MKILLALTFGCLAIFCNQDHWKVHKTFPAAEAKQAVCADGEYFYAIDDAAIGKYSIASGKKIAQWQAPESSHIKHLNSACIHNNQIYLAHSNYPALPRTSSIEIFDTDLHYIGAHNFGQYDGAASWVLWNQESWWVLFAQYSGAVAEPGRTSADTRLDRFDAKWKRLASYTFPPEIIAKVAPKSLSGGAFGPDGSLYCTGHDNAELFRLNIPKTGTVIEHLATLPVTCEGQGIAFYGKRLYTIKRSTREVVVSEWVEN